MKKLLALLIALLLTLSLVACGDDPETETPITSDTESESESESESGSETESESESESESETTSPDNVFDPRSETAYVNGASELYVRSVPSSDSANTIVGTLKEGDSVERIGYNESWSKIIYNGQELYASSKYLSTMAPPTFDPVENKTVYVKVEVSLSVRIKPWMNAESVAYLSNSQDVTLIGMATTADEFGIVWARISYTDSKGNAKEGYINSAYLSEDAPMTFTDVNEMVAVESDSLNLRAEASLQGNVLTTAKKGDTFQRIGIAVSQDDEGIVWSRLIYNGTVCYASSAYLSLVEEAKDFSVEGMSITLSNRFSTVADPAPYSAGFDSDNVAICITKEPLSTITAAGLDANMSLKTYAETIITGYALTATVVEENGLVYFTYVSPLADSDETVTVLAFVYKSADAYWLVQFLSSTNSYSVEKANLFRYADSIIFR